jgi:hypothetical protein
MSIFMAHTTGGDLACAAMRLPALLRLARPAARSAVTVYRMLGCSPLFPSMYRVGCKQQVTENAENTADLG